MDEGRWTKDDGRYGFERWEVGTLGRWDVGTLASWTLQVER